MRYANFNDVPYDVWKLGGKVEITNKDSIPSALHNGQAIAIIPSNTIQITGGNQNSPAFWWGWYLIGAVIVGVLFTAVYRLTIYDTFAVLEATPEANIQELDNGDRIITAADGSTWKWDHLTGVMTQIGGPDTKIADIIKWVAVLAVIMIIGVILVKGSVKVPSIEWGSKPKADQAGVV